MEVKESVLPFHFFKSLKVSLILLALSLACSNLAKANSEDFNKALSEPSIASAPKNIAHAIQTLEAALPGDRRLVSSLPTGNGGAFRYVSNAPAPELMKRLEKAVKSLNLTPTFSEDDIPGLQAQAPLFELIILLESDPENEGTSVLILFEPTR